MITRQKKGKKKRTRLNAQVRRRLILDQATVLIGQRGYHGFSIHELARRCRLTGAALLYYFGSKERLLTALLEDRDRQDAIAVHSVIGSPKEDEALARLTIDDIRGGFRNIVAHNVTQPEIVRLFSILRAEALDPDHPAHDHFVARHSRVIGAYTRLLSPFVEQPLSTARQLSSLMRGLEEQWLECGRGFDLVAEWDRAAALLLPASGRTGEMRAAIRSARDAGALASTTSGPRRRPRKSRTGRSRLSAGRPPALRHRSR